MRSEVDYYDSVYRAAAESPSSCAVSMGNLPKARKRVRQVLVGFKMPLCWSGKRVLDVGCGLGAIAQAFHETGAAVTAVDVSQAAIEQCKARLPEIDFRCDSFPADLGEEGGFDLIWLLDFPLVMNCCAEGLRQTFLRPSLRYLKPDGCFIIGTHSNFSGKRIHGWAHWSLVALWRAKAFWKASGPIIPQLRYCWLSILACPLCRVAGKSAPIFFLVKAADIR